MAQSVADPVADRRAERLVDRYRRARDRRSAWEAHWRDCYDYALPQREVLFGAEPGGKRTDRLFDGTAPDAVDHLAASLLAELTPPWARWFGFEGGPGLSEEEATAIGPLLEEAAETVRVHFDRSTFAVELHQCFLDLVTVGTAALLFEEASPGQTSAFRFTAVPLPELVVEEGSSGRLDVTFRRSGLTVGGLRERFPGAVLPDGVLERAERAPESRFGVLEAVVPEGRGYAYTAILLGADSELGAGGGAEVTLPEGLVVLAEAQFASSPFIIFRWLKVPGEAYGRSPVMKALPDIKTANKIVELVLKNASISVTGIWQADDDGVLNPANIRLVPGAIIPKAVGSAGLTPLEAPGRFDVSQI
ncbi:MAG: portal protein, partial [Rhodospirillaceae bacterium]